MSKICLKKYGIEDVKEIIYNPTYEVLFNEETRPELDGYEKAQETELGALNVCNTAFLHCRIYCYQ